MESEVNATERVMLRTRQQQLEEERKLETYRDELRTLRITLSKTATVLNGKKAELQVLQRQLADRNQRCDVLEKAVSKAKNDVNGMRKNQLTAEEREAQLAKLLEQEYKDKNDLIKEIETMQQARFRAAERLKQLTKDHAATLQDIRSTEAANDKTRAKIKSITKDISTQSQQMYQLDFQLSHLDRKLEKLEGKQYVLAYALIRYTYFEYFESLRK